MTLPSLRVLRPTESRGAVADLDGGIELLRRVRAEGGPATLRLYRPQPTVAFGQRDERLPGFTAATETARRHGFTPVVRRAGGRAAAYHEGTLIVDHVSLDPDAMLKHQDRFVEFGSLFVDVLASIGVPAAVGEIPGEYCAGEHSVHGWAADGTAVKLVGTAQRVIQGAWFFSSVVVVENSAPLRSVLEDVYADMGMELDPSTIGAAEDSGHPNVTVETFTDALLTRYERDYALTSTAAWE